MFIKTYKNESGLFGVYLPVNLAVNVLGFGNVCDSCNTELPNDTEGLYIPVTGEFMCVKCGEEFIRNHKLYAEDAKYQTSEFKNLKSKLNNYGK